MMLVAAGCGGLLSAAFAGEVLINPGNGVETNVAAIVSADAVRVNSGTSGGGIVYIDAASTYSAPTVLGCGTLVSTRVAPTGESSSLGASGVVSIGAGTFRYEGPDGGWTDRTFTNNTPQNAQAAIYDIRNDLTIASDLVQERGSFVKIGHGTLHLAGNGTTRLNVSTVLPDSTNGIQTLFTTNFNGDSPVTGYRGFHVLDGKLVFGEGGGTYKIERGNNPSIGGWTTANGQETDATLEIVGGTVEFQDWIMHGSYNGNVNNTPDRMPQSTWRVKGGTVSCGSCFSMGRNKLGYTVFPQRSAPRLEIYGGSMTLKNDLNMADDRGAYTVVEVTNGTLVAALMQTGRVSGNNDTTNTVIVSGTGVLSLVGDFTNKRDIVSNVHVSNGGVLSLSRIVDDSGMVSLDVSDGGTLSVNEIECLCGTVECRFDGGAVRGRSAGRRVLLPNDAAITAELGPGGLVLSPAAQGETVIRLPLVSESGGLVLRGQSASATNVLAAAQSYGGSTRLENGVLSFEGGGALPSTTDFAWLAGSLLVTNRTQTVRTLALGADGKSVTLGLYVVPGFTPLVVKSGLTLAGTPRLAVKMDGMLASGDYPLVEARAQDRSALLQLASQATFTGNLQENAEASLEVVTTGTRAALVLKVVSTVRAVVPNGGTETVDSLAFVTDASQLTVGPGTMRYTGSGETVPGITLAAGNERVAILEVTRNLTLSSVMIDTAAFMKTGAGDLFLNGAGPFNLGNTKRNKDLALGIGVDGSSPVDTFQHCTVADGRLVIGLKGGGERPEIGQAGWELHVGGVTASPTNGLAEAAGELVIESGAIDCSVLMCGYYSGSTGMGPEGGTHPKLTINGGVVRAKSLTLGYDGTMQTHVAQTLVNMTGGDVKAGTITFQYSPGDTNCPPTTTWIQSGGDVACSSFICGNKAPVNGVYGPARLTVTGGTFTVNGSMKLQNGTDSEMTFGEGATFTCGAISGAGSSSSTLRFDGGTWRAYVPSASAVSVDGLTHLYLARRTLLDVSDSVYSGGWLRLDQAVDADPEAAADDIGLTVTRGAVSFGTNFAASVMTGPLCVSNGVTLWHEGTGGVVSNLVIGTAQDTTPIVLDLDAASGNGFTVLGTLDVRFPVAVRTHAGASPILGEVVGGVYTALVYRASQNVDVSLFVTPDDAGVASVSYEEVSIDDDWKAVVATVVTRAAGSYSMSVRAWSATASGGKWHSAANWTGWAAPDGTGEFAGFRPASATNVPVTLAKPATVGSLVLSGTDTTGYCLAGERLTVDADGALGRLVAESGVHEIAAPLAAGVGLHVDTRTNAAVAFAEIDGDDAVLHVNRGVETGGGTVTLGALEGVKRMSVGCGRTVLTNLSFATEADSLRIGGGTLRYEGPDAVLPGIALAEGKNRAGVVDIPEGTTLALRSMTASGTALVKAGAGDLKLEGTGTFTLGAAASNRVTQAKTYIQANGDSPISTYRRCNVSEGRIVQGSVGDVSDAPNVTCSDFCVGVDSVEGADCEYVMNNGVLNASSFYVDYYHGVTRSCKGQFTLNGGAVTSKWVRLGQTGQGPMYSRPTVVVNGGSWRVSETFTLGHQRASAGATDCSLTVNGGVLDIGGLLELGRAGSNTGTVCICGGVLRAENIVRTSGTGRLHFDGGTYMPYGASGTKLTLKGLTSVTVGAGGATVDTSLAGIYTIAQDMLHDDSLDDVDGGLRVTGGGTLVLAGVNGCTGPTMLENSTLDLDGGAVSFAGLGGKGRVVNGSLTVTDVMRPGGSGTVGRMVLDASLAVTGVMEIELGDCVVSSSSVDVSGAVLLITDLNDLQDGNAHLLIKAEGGVQGTFAETNIDGTGYNVVNSGTRLYLWNGTRSTTILVR